ncbi:phasin family protein [Pararhodospirillum oryzae]|uniref:Phasin n=1 Tax=Pararhodospirillum oryzae TaxID=478448 RepID=A0A512H4G2_9PROT|nr:phasin family protein [Pararhodospirillum oryzae]GEO80308.1 phasin [Pararhodospirillum oryzae]
MAKQPETFFDFDFAKYFSDFKVPGLDVDTLVNSQRRNFEALTHVNKTALDGMQAIFKRQVEILRQAMDEAAEAARDLSKADTPQDKMARQTELAREAFEKAISNMRELMEMATKSNGEVFDLMNNRVSQVMDEMRALTAQHKPGTPTSEKKD